MMWNRRTTVQIKGPTFDGNKGGIAVKISELRYEKQNSVFSNIISKMKAVQ